jgi:hypothetical protein
MFLKPSKNYPKYWSEDKNLIKTKNGYWTMCEMYGKDHCLHIDYWQYNDNKESAIWTKQIIIPLSFYAFYIQFIYQHLGKCHPDLRSKYYIGKPREREKS